MKRLLSFAKWLSSRGIIPRGGIEFVTSLRCIGRRLHLGWKLPRRSPTGMPALVVSPHPDDETFGCGALMSLKRAAGVPVRVILATNGEAVTAASGAVPETVIQARRSQILSACQRLGVEASEVHFLGLPDGRIPHEAQPGFETAVERLLAEMETFPVGEIFAPHPYDHHPDHVAMTQMARAAVLRSGRDWKILYYPVWMWYHASNGLSARLNLKGAWRLDGQAVRARKNAAMAEYLNAPKAPSGILYCGNLPWGFLWNFRHTSEVFFE